MKSKEVEVIKALIENRDMELSINQIACILKKDYKNTHNIVKRLLKMQIVKLERFGNSCRVSLINRPLPLIYEAEYQRRQEILKNKDLSIMYDSFSNLHSRFYVMLIFGSYVKKTQTKGSDIDILFIVPDSEEEKMEKEITNITDTLPINLHINIFSEKDFMAMKSSKKVTVGSEVMMKNIILYGIETYYEMIR